MSDTIQRKHAMNEGCWQAYRAGTVKNFGEFAALLQKDAAPV
jgi:hypothetical protein